MKPCVEELARFLVGEQQWGSISHFFSQALVEPCNAQRCPIRGSLKAIPALGENWEVLWWRLPREATLSASPSSSWMCGGACPVGTARDERTADPRACEPELRISWMGNGEAAVDRCGGGSSARRV